MVSLVKHDLEFILKQIKIAEEHTAGTPLTDLVSHDLLPYGLRTVDGSYNNLGTGNELFGSSSQIMPRLLNPVFNPAEARPANLHPGVPAGPQTSYAQNSGSVYDSQPRIISNLVLDQTIGNPATVIAALVALGHEDPYAILGVPANSVAYQAAVSAYEVAELAQKNLVVAQVSGDATIIAFAQQVVDQADAGKESAFDRRHLRGRHCLHPQRLRRSWRHGAVQRFPDAVRPVLRSRPRPREQGRQWHRLHPAPA